MPKYGEGLGDLVDEVEDVGEAEDGVGVRGREEALHLAHEVVQEGN